MNGLARFLETDEPPERQGFIPTFVPAWPVVEVNRAGIRESLHPERVKSDGIWGSVDPRVKAFAAQIQGDETEKVECHLFRWKSQISIEEAAWRVGRKDGPFRWFPARFEHLVAYGRTVPLDDLQGVIVAPGTTAVWAEPPRSTFRGDPGEGGNELCIASILGGAPIKILNVSVLGGKEPLKFLLPKDTYFLGIRRIP
jgi:hypothetical protein